MTKVVREMDPGLSEFLETSIGKTVSKAELPELIRLSRNAEHLRHIAGGWRRSNGAFASPQLVWSRLLADVRHGSEKNARHRRLTKAAIDVGHDLYSEALVTEICLMNAAVVPEPFRSDALAHVRSLREKVDRIEAFVLSLGATDASGHKGTRASKRRV